MTDENQVSANRDRGRERAIEGILHSRFGERPCGAAERALQKIRSSPADADDSAARPAAPARKTGKPHRKTNGRRRFAPPAGRTWPVWAKVGLAAAAAIVLLLTARFVLDIGRPGRGGGDPTGPDLAAHRPEEKKQGLPDTVAFGKPSGKGTPQVGEDDSSTALARELAWTEGFKADASTGHSKGAPVPEGTRGAPGGPPPRDLAGGGRQGGGRIGGGIPDGATDGGQDHTAIELGAVEGGAPPITGSPKEGGPGSASLRAQIDACLRKLSFRLRIPEHLPTGYQLTELMPGEAGDALVLRYAGGATVARVFVRPTEGPDSPFRKVEVGKRVLQSARRKGLLIAIEDGPADPAGCDAWADLFASGAAPE